jgi:hypothetical protein
MEPACRVGALPDAIPAKAGFLSRVVICHWPEKEGMPFPDEQSETGEHFLPSWYKIYCVLARSRYKFDRSREFILGYKVCGGHWRSVAVQFVSEPEIYHGAGF